MFMSTNKVYGDNPNKLKIYEKSNRWELKTTNKYFEGIDENFQLIKVHIVFGVSKTCRFNCSGIW